MRKWPLHVKILIGFALGVIAGLVVNQYWTDATWQSLGVGDARAYLAGATSEANAAAGWAAEGARLAGRLCKLAGDLFVRVLAFVSVPIVLFMLVAAVAKLGDPRKLGRMGGKTIVLFLFTGFTSAFLGVAMSSLVRPGDYVDNDVRGQLPGAVVATATAEKPAQTAEAKRAAELISQSQQLSGWQFAVDLIPRNPFAAIANAQMLQVVVTAILLGLGLTLLPKAQSDPVIAVFDGLGEAILKLVHVALYAAPVAVFALVATIVAGMGMEIFQALVAFCLVVVAGLAIILCVLYPLLTTLLTRRDNRVGWGRFFWAFAPAQLVAFSSSSSAATLPVTIGCAKDRLGADEEVAGFVCSLGVSFNMDGTAFYQAVSVTFLAQLYGVDLGFAGALQVALMAAVLSIGVPGIPSGGLVIMAAVLSTIGVPPQGIAVILAVDRVLDMCRTVINVSGDGMGTAIIAASEGRLGPDPRLAAKPLN